MKMPFAAIALMVGLLGISSVDACFPLGGPPLGFSQPSYSYVPPPSYGSPYAPYAASKSRMASDRTGYGHDNNLESPPHQCFKRYANYRLECALPIERRTPSSENECQQLCLEKPSCRSLQLDNLVCDLFDDSSSPRSYATSDSIQQQQPSSPFKADDPLEHQEQEDDSPSSYRQRRYAPTNSEQCEPSLIPSSGSVYSLLDTDCGGSGTPAPDSVFSFLSTPLPPLFPQLTTPSQKPDFSPRPVFLGGVEPFATGSSAKQRVPIGGSNLVEVIPETPDCADGSRARIQLIDGISLVEERPIATLQLDSADVCLHICRSNANLDGSRLSRQCRAATFDRASGKCRLVSDAISPNGELNYVPNPDGVYFEKLCIPEGELSLGCDEAIQRIPQHTLDSRASGTGAVVTAQSQVDCIRKCITAQKKLGFDCSAASHYFDWTRDNCYLSRFTRLLRPDIYVAERKQLVDYMELPDCMKRRGWQHDDVSVAGGGGVWSQWSACDEKQLMKSRRRNCTSCEPTIETAPCGGEKLIAESIDAAKRLKQPTAGAGSLFGEQDYKNQEEVSFFGPPQAQTAAAAVGGGRKKGAVAGAAVVAEQSEEVNSECDPHEECCQKSAGVKGVVRGCSVGYRLQKDGKSIPCMPAECH